MKFQKLYSLIFENNDPILITESSKQSLINLGFPEIISTLLIERFGKNAHLIAQWYKDNQKWRFQNDYPKDWFFNQRLSSNTTKNVTDYVKLYNAANTSPIAYEKELKEMDMSASQPIDDHYLNEMKQLLKQQIKEDFFNDFFFNYTLISAIANNTLTELSGYKKLNFKDALIKYNKKQIFEDTKPLLTFKDGFKWINVGKKCELIGNLMKNCGSAGVMSVDKDKTILVLFDSNNSPHVLVTYSPNEKRISGDEGVASSAIKDQYIPYLEDLVKFLNVTFTHEHTKSLFLQIKYDLKNIIKSIDRVPNSEKDHYNQFFEFITNNNEIFYTNGSSVISQENTMKIKHEYPEYFENAKNLNELLWKIFYGKNTHEFNDIIDRYSKFVRDNSK